MTKRRNDTGSANSKPLEQGVHPMARQMAEGIVTKILKEREAKIEQSAITDENIEEWKKALAQICATRAGALFMKMLIKYCGVFSYNNKIDAGMSLILETRQKVYLELIRPFLTPATRSQVESD